MSTQFGFLAAEFREVCTHAIRAENLARNDPRAACFYARLALETAIVWLYRSDGSSTAALTQSHYQVEMAVRFQAFVAVPM